jgi:hypothetical protein
LLLIPFTSVNDLRKTQVECHRAALAAPYWPKYKRISQPPWVTLDNIS